MIAFVLAITTIAPTIAHPSREALRVTRLMINPPREWPVRPLRNGDFGGLEVSCTKLVRLRLTCGHSS
jgi:hypothetical protein